MQPTGIMSKLRNIYKERGQIKQALPYVGNRHHCPCCGWYLRTFLPHGVNPRPNAQCPRCGSVERHRLLWMYLKHRTNFCAARLKVLHFAPELIFDRIFRSMENLDYITADLYSDRAMVKMDITDITYEDDTFDVILCSHVLEHIPDDAKAMSELYRVLKPGGWAILQVPILRETTYEDPTITSPEEREKHFGQNDHVRVYGLDYKDRLENVGFNVKVDDYVRRLGDKDVQRYGLMKKEDIYYCTK